MQINIDQTEATVFNTTQACVTRTETEFFLGEEKVAHICAYTYLGVTFIGPRFSLTGGCLQPLVLLKDKVLACSYKSH